MPKLNKTDIKLLAELENDARQTNSQIAKKLKTSQQVISYRINSLLKKRIIEHFYTIINFTKLGYTQYRTMIRLSNINEQKHKQIILYLKKHSNVLWIIDCGGRWDLLVNFLAKSIIQYDKFINDFKNSFPEQIQNYDVLTTVEGFYFNSDFLTNKTREIKDVIYFIRESKLAGTDKIDLQILNLLSENARINSALIANKIKVSANTVILRIKNMKKIGLITGFKPLIHMENINYNYYKALIKFQNITNEKQKQIINFLATDSRIVSILRLIGMWDFEIEFATKSKEKMILLTRKIRDRFKNIIKEFEVLPLYKEYKYNFFPGDLLS